QFLDLFQEFAVIRVTCGLKQFDQLIRSDSFNESGFADRSITTGFEDFACDPVKIFRGLVRSWEDVYGILDGKGTDLLEPPPHFDAQVSRRIGYLMNQQQPSRRFGPGHIKGTFDQYNQCCGRILQLYQHAWPRYYSASEERMARPFRGNMTKGIFAIIVVIAVVVTIAFT